MKIKQDSFVRALGKNIEIKRFQDTGYALFYEGYWYNIVSGWDKDIIPSLFTKIKAEYFIADNLVKIYKELSYVVS